MAFGEEGGGRVFHFREALLVHFKNGGFGCRTETILHGADGFEPAIAVALEIKNDVDEVFEDFRAGQSSLFRDVTDDDNSGAGGFRGADDEVAAVGDLGNATGGGGDFGEGEGLNGVDDNEVELAAFDGFRDIISAGGAGELQIVGFGAEANGAELDLASGFLTGDVEDGAGLGDFRADLHEEGGFADAGLAGEERNRAEEDAAAEDGVEVGKAGFQTFFFSRDFEVVDGSVIQDFAGGLSAGDGGFFVAFFICGLLQEGVPGAAFAAAAVPAGIDGAALLADKLRVGFCHRDIIHYFADNSVLKLL